MPSTDLDGVAPPPVQHTRTLRGSLDLYVPGALMMIATAKFAEGAVGYSSLPKQPILI